MQALIGRLPRLLDTPQGARQVALTVDKLLERLAEEAVVVAAWCDLLDAYHDHSSTAELCELRVRQLKDLSELRGIDFESQARTLVEVLSDDPYVMRAFGETVAQSALEDMTEAGVSEQRRVELCSQVAAASAQRRTVVVWQVVDNAALESGYLKLGPVELFDQSYWPDGLRPGGALQSSGVGFVPPSELDDWAEAKGFFEHLPEVDNRLFVRMEVPREPASTCRQARP